MPVLPVEMPYDEATLRARGLTLYCLIELPSMLSDLMMVDTLFLTLPCLHT